MKTPMLPSDEIHDQGNAMPITLAESKPPRFGPGTVYRTGGKHPLECTVTDIWRTYDLAGNLVKTRYVSTHLFCGQTVTDHDVVETTIARGLVKETQCQ